MDWRLWCWSYRSARRLDHGQYVRLPVEDDSWDDILEEDLVLRSSGSMTVMLSYPEERDPLFVG